MCTNIYMVVHNMLIVTKTSKQSNKNNSEQQESSHNSIFHNSKNNGRFTLQRSVLRATPTTNLPSTLCVRQRSFVAILYSFPIKVHSPMKHFHAIMMFIPYSAQYSIQIYRMKRVALAWNRFYCLSPVDRVLQSADRHIKRYAADGRLQVKFKVVCRSNGDSSRIRVSACLIKFLNVSRLPSRSDRCIF